MLILSGLCVEYNDEKILTSELDIGIFANRIKNAVSINRVNLILL